MATRTLVVQLLLFSVARLVYSADAGMVHRELRTWYSPDHKYQTEAYLFSYDGNQAIFEKVSGDKVTVAKARLSMADQEYLAFAVGETSKGTSNAVNSPINAAFLTTAEAAMQWIQRDRVLPEYELVAQFTGSPTPVVALALSADGTSVTACMADGSVRAWRLAMPDVGLSLESTLPGNAKCVAMTPTGKYAYIGCDSGKVLFWNTEESKSYGTYAPPKAPVSHLGVTANGTELLVFDESPALHKLTLFERTAPAVIEQDVAPEERTRVDLVGFAPDGRFAVIGNREKLTMNGWFFAGALVEGLGMSTFESPTSQPNTLATSDDLVAFVTHMHELHLQGMPRKADDDIRIVSSPCQVPNIDRLCVSSDQQWTVGIARSGDIEWWHTASFGESCRTAIELKEATAITISADGRFIAVGDKEGVTRIWKLRRLPELSLWRTVQVVKEWLSSEKYELLENLGDRLAKDADPFYWDPGTTKLGTLVMVATAGADTPSNFPRNRGRIQAWRTKCPESKLAMLVDCQSEILQAWEARGGGFANTVTEDGFMKFRMHLARAKEVLAPVLDGDNVPGEAYAMMLEIAKGESWDEKKVQPIVDRIAEECPTAFSAHVARVEMLMPRWGGTPDASAGYAKLVADRLGGESGDIMYCRLASALTYYHSPHEFYSATRFERDRVKRGFAAIAAKRPVEFKSMSIGLRLAWSDEDHDNAKLFAERLVEREHPTWFPSIWPERIQFKGAFSWATSPK